MSFSKIISNSELESIWKHVIVACFKDLLRYLREEDHENRQLGGSDSSQNSDLRPSDYYLE
jgi:hypothetical protein